MKLILRGLCFKEKTRQPSRFQQRLPKDGGGPEPLLSPQPKALAAHFPQTPPRGPARPDRPGRSAASAHARDDVTRAPRTRPSWQEWSRLLPPPRRSRARRAGSRCVRRGGAAGGHGVVAGARGDAAMGLQRLW